MKTLNTLAYAGLVIGLILILVSWLAPQIKNATVSVWLGLSGFVLMIAGGLILLIA